MGFVTPAVGPTNLWGSLPRVRRGGGVGLGVAPVSGSLSNVHLLWGWTRSVGRTSAGARWVFSGKGLLLPDQPGYTPCPAPCSPRGPRHRAGRRGQKHGSETSVTLSPRTTLSQPSSWATRARFGCMLFLHFFTWSQDLCGNRERQDHVGPRPFPPRSQPPLVDRRDGHVASWDAPSPVRVSGLKSRRRFWPQLPARAHPGRLGSRAPGGEPDPD